MSRCRCHSTEAENSDRELVLALLLLPVALFWQTFVLSKGWTWFITSQWGMPCPPLWCLAGLTGMIFILRYNSTTTKDSSNLLGKLSGEMLLHAGSLSVMYGLWSLRDVTIVVQ